MFGSDQQFSRTKEEERDKGNLHMSGLVGHDEGGGEAVLVVEGAAPDRVAHSRDWGVT